MLQPWTARMMNEARQRDLGALARPGRRRHADASARRSVGWASAEMASAPKPSRKARQVPAMGPARPPVTGGSPQPVLHPPSGVRGLTVVTAAQSGESDMTSSMSAGPTRTAEPSRATRRAVAPQLGALLIRAGTRLGGAAFGPS
jgi:hypothetical protein